MISRKYTDSRGKELVIYGDCTNRLLEDASMEFFNVYNKHIQNAIDDPSGWEPRSGKAYKKKGIGNIRVVDSDAKDIALQLACCYTDPAIEIPGVPSHNHPEYSEFFAYPRGQGKLLLINEKAGDLSITEITEITIGPDIFTFIDGNMQHAVIPTPDSGVYVALMRFDPELIKLFGKGNNLVMISSEFVGFD